MHKDKRFHWVDTLRGTAIIAMAIFHILFDLNYTDLVRINTTSGLPLLLARYAQIIFLSLVGFSLSLSYKKNKKYSSFFSKQVKRAGIILFFGLAITLFSYLLFPEAYIVFGVLHFISLAILIGTIIIPLDFLVVTLFFISIIINFQWSGLYSDNPLLIPFGLFPDNFVTLDYFPLFPWFSAVCFGIISGKLLIRHQLMGRLEFLSQPFLNYLGRRSLFIYLIHQPIIIGIIWIFKMFK